MNVAGLSPRPVYVEPFRLDRAKFVPEEAGCYVLTTAQGHILYIGLASSLQTRMCQHLETPKKAPTQEGRAVCFHWLPTTLREATERGWLNMHRVTEGKLPLFNKVDSPVSF
jgi:hypothetical protein